MSLFNLKSKLNPTPINLQGINILLINTESGFGGREVHTVYLYEALKKAGHNPFLLIAKNSKLENELCNRNIPYYACSKIKFMGRRFPLLTKHLITICKAHNIQIIHSDVEKNLHHAKKAAERLPVKVVYTHHRSNPLSKRTVSSIKNIDVAVGVSDKIKNLFEEAQTSHQSNIKHIFRIPPFFNQEKFDNYTPNCPRIDFYKDNFGIIIQDMPIVACIARLEKDKCHELLLQALHKLLNKKKVPAQLMLIGKGPEEDNLKKLSTELGISQYIHFLGYTNNTPGVLYHCDVKVVASKKDEGCPISLIEASLMKKPLIASPGMGTEHSVIHERTGLFFKNNNSNDLANQLERILSNPKWAKKLGENAYKNAKKTLSVDISIQKQVNLYKSILL